jgi:chromosome segregation ATPase
MQADALTERLKFSKAGDLESYHQELLNSKEMFEKELTILRSKKWELDQEQGRVSGRIQAARSALGNHRSVKPNPKLTKKSDLIQWEETERSLSAKVDAVQREQGDLNLMYGDHNHDVEVVGNKLRVAMAEIELTWNRLQRLRGSNEPIMDRTTGLAS